MSERTRLKKLEFTDAETLAGLANNKKIWNNLRDIFPFPYSIEDARSFIELTRSESPQQTFSIIYNGELCGVIGIIPKTDIHRLTAELGFWIGESYWGKGIATEAVRLIIKYAFSDLDCIRLEAEIFEHNSASKKVLEKNGFKTDAFLERSVMKNDIVLNSYLLTLLKD